MGVLLVLGLIAQSPAEPVAFATLQQRDGLYYVEARVGESKKPLQLLLDTGSNVTIVWDREITGGKDDLRPMDVSLLSGHIKTQVGLIAELPEPLKPLQRGKAKFDGMLGATLFADYTVGLDLRGKCLAFFPKDKFLNAAKFWFSSAYVASEKTPVRWVTDGRMISGVEGGPYQARQMYPSLFACEIDKGLNVPLALEGANISALLDTGSDSCSFQPQHFEDVRALKVVRTEDVKSVYGSHRERIYSLPEIGLAGFKIKAVETTISDKFPNLVSNKVMAQYRWLFSKSEGVGLAAAY